MKDQQEHKKFWDKLLYKYRFVIMTESSFEERFSITVSLLNILFFFACFIFGYFFVSLLLIAYTPLSDYVPGKASKEIQKDLIILSLKTDSLKSALENRDLYLNNISNIVNGSDMLFNTKSSDAEQQHTQIENEKIVSMLIIVILYKLL